MNMVKMWTRGRLGNILFQLAAGYSYALDHGMEFTLNDTTADPIMQPLYFQHLVNKNWNPDKPSKFIREMQHNYVPIPWEDDWKNYNIQFITGYYQTEKYFNHKRKEVLKLFNIPYNPIDAVSVHVRRSDYLTIPGKHILQTDSFFNKCFEVFNRGLGYNRFIVFSDDISFCREYFKSWPYYFEYSEGNSPLQDLSEMSSCRHHIGSASTFSWWGSWLTQHDDSVTLLPDEWFQSTQKENTSDIVPDSMRWQKINKYGEAVA